MLNESPIVSIITPSLNSGKYIEQAIMSVRAQDYWGIEHVIVEGDSIDNTIQIIEKHRNRYNITLMVGRDSGPNEAVNKGMSIARGEIIGYVDADNLLLPWAVSSVVKIFRLHPEVDFVYGDMILMPMGGDYATLAFDPPVDALKTHLSFGSTNLQPLFWSKRVLETLVGFDETLRIADDYEFCTHAAKQFKFFKVDEPFSWSRYRRESISISDPSLLKANRVVISSRHFGRRSNLSPRLTLYEIGWAAFCASGLMRILAAE